MFGLIESYGLILFSIGVIFFFLGGIFNFDWITEGGIGMMVLGALIFIGASLITAHNKIEKINWSQVANCTNKAYHLNLNTTLAKYAWYNSSYASSISAELQSCGA